MDTNHTKIILEHWFLIISVATPIFLIIAGAIALFKYKIPNLERKLKEMEDNVNSHKRQMDPHPHLAGCLVVEKRITSSISTLLESIKRDIFRRLDEMDNSRDEARKEIGGIHILIANLSSDLRNHINNSNEYKIGELADMIVNKLNKDKEGGEKNG